MRRLIPRRWGVRGSAMSVASADAGDRGGPCETSERPQRGQRRRSASPLEVVVGAAMGDRIPPGFWRDEGELEIGFGWLVGAASATVLTAGAALLVSSSRRVSIVGRKPVAEESEGLTG
jgi:hypothetical protein